MSDRGVNRIRVGSASSFTDRVSDLSAIGVIHSTSGPISSRVLKIHFKKLSILRSLLR